MSLGSLPCTANGDDGMAFAFVMGTRSFCGDSQADSPTQYAEGSAFSKAYGRSKGRPPQATIDVPSDPFGQANSRAAAGYMCDE